MASGAKAKGAAVGLGEGAAKATTTAPLTGDDAVRDTMNRVFYWLGLPLHTVENAAPVRHPSAKPEAKGEQGSSGGKPKDAVEGKAAVIARLRQIYASGHAELFDMIGRDLGWNNWARPRK